MDYDFQPQTLEGDITMKVSHVKEQIKEYDRLQGLICDIEKAIKDLDRVRTVESTHLTLTTATFLGGVISLEDPNQETVTVTLSSEVTNLLRDELKKLLYKAWGELKTKQDTLEVQ